MKLNVGFFTLISFAASGQTIEKLKLDLTAVQTIPEAHEFLKSHEGLIGDLVVIRSGYDTTALDQELLSTNKGDIIDFDSEDKKTHFFYKILITTNVNSLRVQYIYLNDRDISKNQVDSLRSLIIKRYNNGESFAALASAYSMDVNAKKGGDRGWYEEGIRTPEFDQAIKKRNVGEVFTLDIPVSTLFDIPGTTISYSWYYVIKKTHPVRVDKKITVLYFEVKNP